MALTLTAYVTRDELGLGDLDINDGVNFKVAGAFMGGSVAWQRNNVSSPYIDGDITVSRRRGDIVEPVEIWVYGDNHTELRDNLGELLTAFTQENYNLSFNFDGRNRKYDCKCADYTVSYEQAFVHSKMHKVVFNIPRNPIAIYGGIN
jgi:hypothetical protein